MGKDLIVNTQIIKKEPRHKMVIRIGNHQSLEDFLNSSTQTTVGEMVDFKPDFMGDKVWNQVKNLNMRDPDQKQKFVQAVGAVQWDVVQSSGFIDAGTDLVLIQKIYLG